MKKDNLNKAIRIASIVHAGTKGKSKEPAILHPIRVMMKMDDKKSRIVAVLHDVVESKKINLDDLLNSGFSKNICLTIDLLSRKDYEKYSNYISRLKKSQLAVKVKLADLEDNYLTKISSKKLSKIDKEKIKKYKKYYKELSGKKLYQVSK